MLLSVNWYISMSIEGEDGSGRRRRETASAVLRPVRPVDARTGPRRAPHRRRRSRRRCATRSSASRWRPARRCGIACCRERFGVSRTPVREALIRLAEEGLVDIFPQSGTFVSRIPSAAIPEAVLVRQALEGVTVEAAARAPERPISRRSTMCWRCSARSRPSGDTRGFHADRRGLPRDAGGARRPSGDLAPAAARQDADRPRPSPYPAGARPDAIR